MDEQFMAEAIKLADQAKREGNFPFGALVVKNGEAIATGRCFELTKTDVTQHAELLAISEACRKLGSLDLSDCTLYASGEPCNMCASAAFQANIGRVVIGATRDDLANFFRHRAIRISDLAKDSSHPIKIETGVLKDQAAKLFEGVKK